MTTRHEEQDSRFAQAMLEEALNNVVIKMLLAEISTRLREEVLQEVIFHEQDGLAPSLDSLSMQHTRGDLYIGALLPWYSKEYLNNTVEGRSILLDALDRCLMRAANITTYHDFIALMKVIDGMAYMYDLFQTQKENSSHLKRKAYIAPTADEVSIRQKRPEQVLAITYGIGTTLNKDLSSSAKAPLGTYSGKARFFITETAHRKKIWFEKLVEQGDEPSLPLVASTSNAAAKVFMMAHGLNLFLDGDEKFNLDTAQMFANCVMAYLVYCGHHSCVEVMEVWNRALDYLAIEHPEQLPDMLSISNDNSFTAYMEEESAIERKLPYVRVGSHESFLHESYAKTVIERTEVLLSESPDLSFNRSKSSAFVCR